ncbi:MAG: hypothetical protein IJO20_04335 [Ruminococcus sp.]|nr:hypothetical protein [Ruminococcus sp.]
MKVIIDKLRKYNLTEKLFKGKNKNSILSIVALVECIILLCITTFSWIESSSSLKIKGEDLPIHSNINYRFDVKDGATNMVDLSTYFRPTALYQLAQASTPDAKNFYFKKDGAATYRLGDTTDYNTSYYNIDFQVHNETAKSYNYYFNKADIFDVTSDNPDVTDAMLVIAEKAMRVSVTAGTTSSNTRIYSIDSKTYNAVNTKAGGTKSTTSTGLSNGSQYNYQTNTNANLFVFSTTGGGDDTKVNVKIWFEEKDAQFAALTAAQKTALLGCTVKINLQFVNAASNFQTFFFDDYTFSTKEGFEGHHVTQEDQTKSLYFYYKEGTTISVVPMTTIDSQTEATRWVTASDEGEATPRISDDMRKHLATNPADGYFFYGTYNAGTGVKNEQYKWPITAPAVNDGDVYIFKALSVLKNNTGNVGYGVWDDTDIELFQFKDQTSSATDEDYNAYGYQFITRAGENREITQNRLYLSDSTTASAKATRMYYDAATDTFKGYFEVFEDNETPIFSFTSTDSYTDATIKVQWTASNPESYYDDDVKIYTALGYEGTGLVSSQSKAAGVGTWMKTEQILFSTELVDASMNKDLRYKVSAIINGTRRYYYMTKHKNALTWGAFVPKDSGTTTSNYISFQRFNGLTSTSNAGTWNSGTAAVARNGSSIYYATDMAASTSHGQWHIAVVVDGSADNVVNDVLSSVENSKLEYSVDGGTTYFEMNELDNYRWYTNDFDSTVTTINYRWTAYTGPGVNEAVFTYGHDLANGIYFNITE